MKKNRYLFLDLEDTVVEPVTFGWSNPKLINIEKVRTFIQQFEPTAVHIFSFAVATQTDRTEFETHVKPLLEAELGVAITHCPTLFDDIIPACSRQANLAAGTVSIDDVCDFWGKQGAFKYYVQQVFKGLGQPVAVALLDDVVTDEDFNYPALGLAGWIRNIAQLALAPKPSGALSKPKNLPKKYAKAEKYMLRSMPTVRGKYWGFCFGRWQKILVTALPDGGGTGSLLYAPIDKRGYPHSQAVALSNCSAFYGPMNAWGENQPRISKAKLKKVGVASHWLTATSN